MPYTALDIREGQREAKAEADDRALERSVNAAATLPLSSEHKDAVSEYLLHLDFTDEQYEAIDNLLIKVALGGTATADDIKIVLSVGDIKEIIEREILS